ncbi:FUSC family protein [Yoonia maritima]|uniref:FUSC family protein n=1 Tax=Yoonia maritima TaxID=1435347 RepID=UPI0013A5F74F|nr:FUSC family protein [Yoonia maritima]
MYVAPRPKVADDPHFAIRLGLAVVAGFVAMAVLQPQLAPICVALPIGLIAGLRKAFNPARAIGGAVAFGIVVWLMAGIVAITRPVPMLMLLGMFLFYFLGFFVTRRTGSPFGMLVLIAAALMSIVGMKNPAMLNIFRDGFLLGCVVAAVTIPTLYLLIPARTKDLHEDAPRPAAGHHGGGALIRSVVLTALCFWLYAVLPVSDLILAIAAVFPLIFPTKHEAFAEAAERSWATILGGIIALVVLAIYGFSAHFLVLLLLMFLTGWGFGIAMMHGRLSASVYQFGLSVAAVLVATSLTTSNPELAAFQRVCLTLAGTLVASLAVAVLDRLLLTPIEHEDRHSPHPAIQRRRFEREFDV